MPARPVTVLDLQLRDFARHSHLTGSVSMYREERVGFEVSGRVMAVLDVGKEVQGPAFREDGQQVQPGEMISKLDDTRYRLQVNAIGARLRSLKKQLEAQRIDVDQIAQANLRAANARLQASENDIHAAQEEVEAKRAERTLAQQTLERQKSLLQQDAGSQQAVDDSQSRYDSNVARTAQAEAALEAKRGFREAQLAGVATAEATIALKQAEVEATTAQIEEVHEGLRRAEQDLDDCVLLAPFAGRITKVHVSQGAVVEPGTPVVTLSLMDPIQVRVAVSADKDRKIQTGDRALLYPKDPVDPAGNPMEVYALVYEKGAVADPVTRTFRIDLMVRNRRRLIQDVDPEAKGLPTVEDFLPAVHRYEGEGGPLYVNTSCIYRQDGKTYVLRLPGVSFSRESQKSAAGQHVPELVEVELGDEYFSVAKWNFRSVTSDGDLREGDFLATHPVREHLKGLVIDRPQWLLRPGDLVPVQFFLDNTPEGFYVPINAITAHDDKHRVFVVEGEVARSRQVSVHESFGESRRIEGAGITVGARVIVGGVHYISDGQPVSVVGHESLQP